MHTLVKIGLIKAVMAITEGKLVDFVFNGMYYNMSTVNSGEGDALVDTVKVSVKWIDNKHVELSKLMKILSNKICEHDSNAIDLVCKFTKPCKYVFDLASKSVIFKDGRIVSFGVVPTFSFGDVPTFSFGDVPTSSEKEDTVDFKVVETITRTKTINIEIHSDEIEKLIKREIAKKYGFDEKSAEWVRGDFDVSQYLRGYSAKINIKLD